ncbi:hypothetical protein [Rhizobium sp. RU20A]|uniref:hypothetical protein n=1 Tax=Rhizobium sp. RU20A TaxID=1907412 RepID=UPI001FCE843E|nr:hypothetical protein [Rhizobium sp. RU20A]
MLKFIDPDHPFYRPLWVRLLIVGFTSGWTAVEFMNGNEMWGYLFLAMAAYTGASLLLFYKPKDPEPAAESEAGAMTADEASSTTGAAEPVAVEKKDA